MNYFGRIFSNISQAYSELNPATLTGAIDVIVVEQEDGTLLTSPFHVRFGKMGVLRSREKIVDIEINDEPVDIHMKLGDSGEAYFLEEFDDNDDENADGEDNEDVQSIDQNSSETIPDGQINSDSINSNNNEHDKDNESLSSVPNAPTSDKIIAQNDQSLSTDSSAPTTSSSGSQKRTRRKKKTKHGQKPSLTQNFFESAEFSNKNEESNEGQQHPKVSNYQQASDNDLLHPFSDSEYDMKKQRDSISLDSYKSDSEIETSRNEKLYSQDYISWDWGELPHVKNDSTPILNHAISTKTMHSSPKNSKSMLGGVLNFMIKDQDNSEMIKKANDNKNIRQNDDDKGIYLDELDPNDMNPEVAAKYFPKFRSNSTSKPINHLTATSSDDDIESGKGPSLSNSPKSAEFNYQQNENSVNSDFVDRVNEQLMMPCDLYNLSQIYHDMSMSLCGSVEDLIENPANTERFLQSIISFDDFNENPLLILDNPNLVIRMGSEYHTLKMATSMILSLLLFQRPLSAKTMQFLKDKCIPKKKSTQNSSRSWRSWFRSPTQSESLEPQTVASTSKDTKVNNSPNTLSAANVTPSKQNVQSNNHSSNSIEYVSDDETINSVVINNNRNSTTDSANKQDQTMMSKKKYRKVLRLNSDILKKLNLRKGSNKIKYSVTTAYQGTTSCECNIYLWSYGDKIIISDIDGTITKSDVLGHILPYIGKDWAQNGVSKLFTSIEKNGYKFLYLSARAIGQARITRDYLTSICQEGECLPDGPILLSPTSLFYALHREVIEKKPEEFKISCLNDINTLFPVNPFFAGFGNKINDTWAYKAVGIDISRIFTINHRGELKLERIMSFKSSYSELSQFVDQMFPPLNKERLIDPHTEDFNSFLYWRTDIPTLDDNELFGTSSSSITSTAGAANGSSSSSLLTLSST